MAWPQPRDTGINYQGSSTHEFRGIKAEPISFALNVNPIGLLRDCTACKEKYHNRQPGSQWVQRR